MGSCSKVFKVVFCTLILLGIIWFFFVGILANRALKSVKVPAPSSGGTLVSRKFIGRDKHDSHWHSDFNYVSKRRVPNGPDPIHNRRAAKSRRPPTWA